MFTRRDSYSLNLVQVNSILRETHQLVCTCSFFLQILNIIHLISLNYLFLGTPQYRTNNTVRTPAKFWELPNWNAAVCIILNEVQMASYSCSIALLVFPSVWDKNHVTHIFICQIEMCRLNAHKSILCILVLTKSSHHSTKQSQGFNW